MDASKSINSKKLEEKITINYLLLAGVSLLIILHLSCLYVSGLAIFVAIIENLIIYFFLLRGDYKAALTYMCLFYTTSYSNSLFFGTSHGLDTIYCVENLPLLHGYLMLFSFIILFLCVKFSKKRRKNKIPTAPNTLSTFAIYTICAGVVMGFLTILINGFQYRAIVSDLNQCVNPALMILVFGDVFGEDPRYCKKYSSLVIHILLSYIIIAWVTSTLNIFADFVQVRDKVLMLPLPSFYFSSIILFVGLMKTYRDKLIIIIAFISTVYFQLFFDSCMNGKSWIVFTTTLVVGLYYLTRSMKKNFIMPGAILVILVFFAIKIVPKVNTFISDSQNMKLLEFVSLFAAADSGDLDDMDQSSQFRFIEFLNVTDQYIKEPIFSLTGRGYGGSIHANGFFIDRTDSGFTDDQYDSDKFYRLHESVNVIFLKFGLIGLIFFTVILFQLIKGIKNTPFCYIGFVWFIFFWGYENSLLFIGLPSMVLGYLSVIYNKQIQPSFVQLSKGTN